MDWKIENNKLLADVNDDGEFNELCDGFEIVDKVVDLVSKEEKLTLKIYKNYGDKIVEIDSCCLSKTRLFNTLSRYGVMFYEDDDTLESIKEVFYQMQNDAPVQYRHNIIGYREIAGKLCFLAQNPVGDLSEYQKQSVFIYDHYKPKGSFKLWRKFVLKNLIHSTPLCMVLALGLTSVIAYVLKEKGIFCDTLMWALIGDSSTGKSTILVLLASFTGSKRHLIHNFDTTDNAFAAVMKENPGMLTLMDEATHTPNLDWDKLLYRIADGKEKLRCKGDGSLKENVDYTGSVVFASEYSILERTHENPGEIARIIEFTEPWFDDGDLPERIEEFCSNNYGWISPMAAELVLSKGFDKKIVRKYRWYYTRFCSELTNKSDNGVCRRLAKRLAIILVAGWLFEKVAKIDLHLEKVYVLLRDHYLRASEKFETFDKVKMLTEGIEGRIARNIQQFPHESTLKEKSKRSTREGSWGFRGTFLGQACYWIQGEVFRRMVRDYSQFGIRTACYKLEEKGRLVKPYDDRYCDKPRYINYDASCYCFLMPQKVSIMEHIQALSPVNRTAKELQKSLGCDYYGEEHYTDFSAIKPNNLMLAGFLKPSSQTAKIIVNSCLKKAIHITSENRYVHLMPVPDKGVILLSGTEIVQNDLKLKYETSYDGICIDISGNVVDEILKEFDISVGAYKRLLCWDIETETHDDKIIAVINLKNDACLALCDIDSEDAMALNIDNNKKAKNFRRKSLLDDEE